MANRARVRGGDGPPARQEDGRWHELLGIAAALFARQGYRSTTLQDIADEFGVLKGSLYHYIRSKDELLYEVVHSVATRGLDNLRELAAVGTDPAERLRRVIRGHVLYLIDNLVPTTVLLHEIEQLPEPLRERIPVREYADVLTELITEAQRAGVVKPDADPHLATLAVLGAVNWVYRWYRPDGDQPAEKIADQYADLLVDGLLVRP